MSRRMLNRILLLGVGMVMVAAALAQTVPAGQTGAGPAPVSAPATLEQRLNLQEVAAHWLRGSAPATAEDMAGLIAEKKITRVIALLAESELPAGERAAVEKAGISLEIQPVLLEGADTAENVRVDRARVRALVEQLAAQKTGLTYVHCLSGATRSSVVNFTYRVLVEGWDYARALQEAIARGLDPAKTSGVVEDLKLLASGLGELPVVRGAPISDADLLTPGEKMRVAGVSLNVKKKGSGPAVYVLHGGPGESHKAMRPYLDPLARNHTLVYYDQRGCGDSAKSQLMEGYTLARYVADLDGLRLALGHEQISLIAHSSGAILALEYALAHRAQVDKLVLVSAWASGEELGPYIPLIEQLLTARDKVIFNEGLSAVVSEHRQPNDAELAGFLRLFTPYTFFGRMAPEFRTDWDRRAQVTALVNQTLGPECFKTLDLRPRLKTLDGLPTLVASGKFDVIVPPGVARTIADLIPGARFEVFERSGHFPFVEEQERFLSVVEAFLSGANPPPAPGK